jgi:tripartite-type tricarboxylate transporter receptor subunit TctC
MKLPRRNFLHLAAGAAALPAVSRVTWAQAYPTRPVRIIVAVAAGGTSDILARMMGQWLSDRLGHPFVIENRPGGGGNIATEAVVRAPADGYTLLQVSAAAAINATLYDKLNFNFIRDITPVASIDREPLIMVVSSSVPGRGEYGPRRGPALVDLLGGQVQVMFASMSSAIEYVRNGKLRALAVTSVMRSEALPQIPAVSAHSRGRRGG